MKKLCLTLALLFALSALPAAGADEGGIDAIVPEAAARLGEIFAGRVFGSDTDLSKHPGLLKADDVTGPFLCVLAAEGKPYVPDVSGKEKADPALPAGAVIAAADDVPEEYLLNLVTDEKTEAVLSGARPAVFALLEYTGYYFIAQYTNGLKLYFYRTRVSFYDLASGALLAWMDTTESRSAPQILNSNMYKNDGQRHVLSNGTFRFWDKGLNELFYDEGRYLVLGTELYGVPEDAETLTVPEGVTSIRMFVGQKHPAKALVLPEGLRTVGSSAFSGSALETIVFPDSLRFVMTGAFSGTPWWNARSEDDFVIAGDGLLLRARAEGDEVTLPPEVKYVMPKALSGLNCRVLIVPETVVQLCGPNSGYAPYTENEAIETIVLKGGLTREVTETNLLLAGRSPNLKAVVVECESDEPLHDSWISAVKEDLEKLTVYCADGSAAAEWCDAHGVRRLPLEAYEP